MSAESAAFSALFGDAAGLEARRAELRQVYWLGGSPCAGKSSVADLLGERFGLKVFHPDNEMARRSAEATDAAQPTLARLRRMSCDELWLRPVATQVATAAAAYDELFGLILEELPALAKGEPLLVEDNALLPARVMPLLTDANQAAWLVADAAAQRARYADRPWVADVLRDCSDPEEAFDRWMRRDARLADWVAETTRRWDGQLLRVDGTETLDEVVDWLAGAYGL